MRTLKLAALLGVGLTLGACGTFDAPNQNYSTLQDLTTAPTKIGLATAAQGLFLNVRQSHSALGLGILGRESYSLDGSNPQTVPQYYTGFNQLSSYWTGAYSGIKQADIVIAGADAAVGITAAEKEGFKGFAKTMKAWLLFMVIRQTDAGGASLSALANPTDAPPPIASKAAVYTQILTWLDEARTHLLAAGAGALPVTMTPGFADFQTAPAFIKFNRGVRAKVNMTLTQTDPASVNPNNAALWAQVLTDLAASFIDTTVSLQGGALNTYTTNPGDALNPYYDPTARQRYAHFSLFSQAQLKSAGGPRDDRFTSKVYSLLDPGKTPGVDTAFVRYGFPVAWAFNRYNSTTASVPVLKNEELVLLRAEANVNLGNNAAALLDINTVRVKSGGLPPYTGDATLKQPATLLDELLYDKFFSLLYENGDRWVDMRRYGRLATLPRDRTGDLVWPNLRIPVNECVPRGNPAPAGCTAQPGV